MSSSQAFADHAPFLSNLPSLSPTRAPPNHCYPTFPIYSGTGRMAHLKTVNQRFKNGFREGGSATKKAAKSESA